MVNRTPGAITIVGTGVNGHSPDGTPAATNSLVPYARFLTQGNLLISELLSYAIRRVSVTTSAEHRRGNGEVNFNGDGQPATSAALGLWAATWRRTRETFTSETATGACGGWMRSGIITTIAAAARRASAS